MKNIVNRLFRVLLIASVGGILFVNIEAAKLSPASAVAVERAGKYVVCRRCDSQF